MDNEVKQLDNSIRAAEDRRTYLEGQLATVKPDTPIMSSTGERVMDPQSRLRALEVALADLQSKFSQDHPDIIKKIHFNAYVSLSFAFFAGTMRIETEIRSIRMRCFGNFFAY